MPHRGESYVTHLMAALPGVGFSPHPWRSAIATYGREHLGWAKGDVKLILDHMEGVESDDVTGKHYDTDPAMVKKRAMMTAWVAWLDKLADAAIVADQKLLDHEAIREAVYRERYDDDRWKAALARSAKTGRLPWSAPSGDL